MNPVKTLAVSFASGVFLLAATISAAAQTTWNYFIWDAGAGNSLVTWNVTGSLATAPGSVLVGTESALALTVEAPGIFSDSFLSAGMPQSLPVLDGSYFQYGEGGVFAPISLYDTGNAAGGGNDTFGLMAPLLPHARPGELLLYIPGTQSVLLPIAFSDFNPGAYQSQASGLDTALTVNLTVAAVPEPCAQTLAALALLGAAIQGRKRSRPGKEGMGSGPGRG